VCDQEAAAIYDDWASKDGNAGLQQSDVDILWELGGGNPDGTGMLCYIIFSIRFVEYK